MKYEARTVSAKLELAPVELERFDNEIPTTSVGTVLTVQ